VPGVKAKNFSTQAKNAQTCWPRRNATWFFKRLLTLFNILLQNSQKEATCLKKEFLQSPRTDFSVFQRRRYLCPGKRQQAQRQIHLPEGLQGLHGARRSGFAKPPISPDAKTQAQWTRTFEKKDFADFGCQPEWEALSEKDITDIYTYLHDHAADSPTPAKCK
jgi:hypothetical protein